MDLDGENRIIVKEGLKKLTHTKNHGLRALIAANGLSDAQLSAYHIGFVLGPCINAGGRLETAKHSLKLLLAEDAREAEQLASHLRTLNDDRKKMTQEGVELACRMIDTTELGADRVLVVYLPDCHESIAGIVAGKLRERYYRPVFVVTDAENGAKGSGRSIEAYSMFEEMVKCSDVFTKFGGHPMAAGFSLDRDRIDEMRRRLNANCMLTADDLTQKITIDVPMPVGYITRELIEGLDVLEPFGKGNEKPLFAEKNLRLLSARVLGKNKNVLKLMTADASGTMMEAMYFGDVEQFRRNLVDAFGETEVQKLYWGRENATHASFIYYPSINEYQGRVTLQIVVKNYQF
jgi:single-stranded-DNA-specific exonuclease